MESNYEPVVQAVGLTKMFRDFWCRPKARAVNGIDFEIKPIVCDGIEACRVALLKKSKNVLDANFVEGMACLGGCIGGAGCLTHGEKNKSEVDKYSTEAAGKSISGAIAEAK